MLARAMERDAVDGQELRALRDTSPTLRRIVLRSWLAEEKTESNAGSPGAVEVDDGDADAALDGQCAALDGVLAGEVGPPPQPEPELESADEGSGAAAGGEQLVVAQQLQISLATAAVRSVRINRARPGMDLGIVLKTSSDGHVICAEIQGAAAAAGIVAGTPVMAVAGVSMEGQPIGAGVAAIQGLPPGSPVDLVLAPPAPNWQATLQAPIRMAPQQQSGSDAFCSDAFCRGSFCGLRVNWDHLCTSCSGLCVSLVAWVGIGVLLRNHCDAHPGEQFVARGRTWMEAWIGAAPVWARNSMLVFIVSKSVRHAAGLGDGGTGLVQTLLVTGGVGATGAADQAGWTAIVGGGGVAQASFEDARRALKLEPRQAIAAAAAKLLLWHWSQPLAYLWVFLFVYYCELSFTQQILGSVVALREIVYMLTTIVAAVCCPAYLLLDIGSVWTQAKTRLERGTRMAMYILTPHNYVALCLANRFRGAKDVFILLAACQVVADFVSCYALPRRGGQFSLPISLNLTGDSASQTGTFSLLATAAESSSGSTSVATSLEWSLDGEDLSLSWSGWDSLLLQQKGTPIALIFGYGITAAGFVLFFGPISVASLLAAAVDETKSKAERGIKGATGGTMGLGLFYLLLLFGLLAGGFDVQCAGLLGSYPCDSFAPCEHGTCTRGLLACDAGFEVSLDVDEYCEVRLQALWI
jgi:hypothetical protein